VLEKNWDYYNPVKRYHLIINRCVKPWKEAEALMSIYETLMFINLYICHVEGSEIIKVSGAAKYNNVS
jgi:hypothetical protein